MRTYSLAVLAFSLPLVLGSFAGRAMATSRGDFQVNTALELANLCRAAPDDPNYVAAIHFCEGFMVGAYRYHLATLDGPSTRKVICLPDQTPSRDEAVLKFVAWLDEHPQYRSDDPVEAQFKWLAETWPCKD